MNDSGPGQKDAWYVSSLARGLAVLRAFSDARPVLTTTEVAEACDMSRAAARRFLMTLEDLGYVRADGQRYALTAMALDLGFSYLSSMRAGDFIQPFLDELTANCGETSSLAILDLPNVVYIARSPTKRVVTLQVGIGTRVPAHASSLGKAMLAHLEPAALDAALSAAVLRGYTARTITEPDKLRDELAKVRKDGFAIASSELEYGITSIAIPVRGARGEVVAAINVSTHESRHNPARLAEDFLPELRNAAEGIERCLRASPGMSLNLIG